ncbi:MAG: GTP 3',8-cyclase MoaA [Deltaproteobacteria bacterium]|nr:GTP 3',8-cyclase MoaA [Deltaproteobacteria bacterium]
MLCARVSVATGAGVLHPVASLRPDPRRVEALHAARSAAGLGPPEPLVPDLTSRRLEDRFRRRINYLRVSVTDRCNLRCTYCMPAEGVSPLGHDAILSYEEILRVARISLGLGIEKIRITGGEPLVRRGILGFVEQMARLPGLQDLSLTTNGLLLGSLAHDLRRAGLRRVNVSLDTLRPEVFRQVTRFDGLERVLEGLRAAKDAGLAPIKVNVVAMRGVNDGEIVDFGEFAEENGYEVRFIEFMPSRADAWEERKVLTASEILHVLSSHFRLAPLVAEGVSGPSRTFALPGGGRVGVISPMSDHFCGTCNRLRLTAEGRLRSCLFSDRETDLRTLLRSGADDEAVAAMVRDAGEGKPERHGLGGDGSDDRGCGLAMNRVGG